ncbi:MAG: cell division protein ZapE [Pseudomonadota bacterium]
MSVSQEYQARIARGELTSDPAQQTVISEFDALIKALDGYKPAASWIAGGLFGAKKARPKGLYIYGGVGRGKSMLMDMFYALAPRKRKRRVHFHAFMQEVHGALNAARKTGLKDPMRPVGEKIVESASLLCLDEMQITDITDAMLVGRLFEMLLDAGVIVVTTSNRPPDDLYKDGLNRNLFLPFIDLMKTRLNVLELASDTDHRQNRIADEIRYFTPLGKKTEAAIDALWHDLSGGHGKPMHLKIGTRDIDLPHVSNGVLRASFDDLCAKPLGAADYLKIAETFRVIFLTDIPKLSKSRANEAKRFVTLIDALYEAGTILIASAAVTPETLFTEGTGAFEFERTASRLAEMQSADWGK